MIYLYFIGNNSRNIRPAPPLKRGWWVSLHTLQFPNKGLFFFYPIQHVTKMLNNISVLVIWSIRMFSLNWVDVETSHNREKWHHTLSWPLRWRTGWLLASGATFLHSWSTRSRSWACCSDDIIIWAGTLRGHSGVVNYLMSQSFLSCANI